MTDLISEIEAINLVGRSIFAKGWIGEARERGCRMTLTALSSGDLKLITERGPRPGKRGGVLIDPCPQSEEKKLDQALGRRERATAQRGTAAQWLIDHSLDAQVSRGEIGYDRGAIVAALKVDPPKADQQTAKPGRPSKIAVIGALMLEDVTSGRRTKSEIKAARGKTLQKWFGADPATCKKAIKQAF